MIIEGWIECKLGDLLTLKNGFAFKSSRYTLEGIPVIRIGDINDWVVDESQAKCIAEDDEYDKYIVEKGDILIAMSGATTGKFGIYNSIRKAYQNQRVGKLKLNSKKFIDKKYIFNLLYSLKFQIEKDAYGGAQPNISAGKIHALKIVLAPLPEQQAIVAKIEELFSDLDKGIADLKKAQGQLKIYRQAVLKKAFEGKLTKEWREEQSDLPTADELLEQIKEERQKHFGQQIESWKHAVNAWEANGKEGKKPTKPTKLKDLTSREISNPYDLSIPSEWFCIPLEYLSDFITKGTTPKSSELFADNGDVPFIKVYNLTFNGELDFSVSPTFVSIETHKNFLQRSIIYPNDILMNIVGPPLGKVSIVPDTYPEWNMNQAMVRFRPVNSVLPKFLANYLMMAWTIHQVSKKAKATAGQFNLTLQICREIILPVCPINEQHQIVQEIESRLSVCDKVEESISESLEKAKALRQSILKKAFEGTLLSEEELTACKAAKDYEPASVLLEKIKVEKK